MTQDEIIEMAREAGDLVVDARGRMDFSFDEYGLTAFANLVAAKEREAVIQIIKETPFSNWFQADVIEAIKARGEQE